MLVANIPSYMGGVDLWQNEGENPENFDPQSIHDKMLEVVSITGAWHLGTLQVSDLVQKPLKDEVNGGDLKKELINCI